ncbi:MAG: hypothetical protein H0T51_19850, partial [Pirellulales bacterium]|nr:hypothetical protein [Pirellulales bacterium]
MARRRKPIDDDLDDEEEVAPPRRLRRPRKRWRVAFVLVALIVLTITAPSIIAKSQLRNALLSSALPPGAGKLTAADAVFSWTSGQGLAGVAHVDSSGAPVFTAEKVTVSRSLIGLASNQNDLGKVVLTRPVVHLDTRDGGSNLEDVLLAIATAAAAQPQHAAPNDSNNAAKTVEVEIIDGAILGRDAATGQHWRIDALALTAKPLTELNAWDVTATGVMSIASRGVLAPGAAQTNVALAPDRPTT